MIDPALATDPTTITTTDNILATHSETSVSVAEAAVALKVAEVTIYKYCSRGVRIRSGERIVLPSYPLNGRKWIPIDGLKWFVARQLQARAPMSEAAQ